MARFSRYRGGVPYLAVLVADLLVWGCSLQEGAAESSLANAQAAEKAPAAAPAPDLVPPSKDGRPVNRLARETSPYLLLHAHNPVDWYPWGPEALEKAKKEDKLIFLSIGYSSCHWCHVMEHKVFSNPEIARTMNENFVNIKIDREERPDLDDVYMTALSLYFQAIGSSQTGGWPLSMFLTPDAKPLGGGTYFPPEDQDGQMGFPTLMKRVVQSWKEKRKEFENNAELLTKAVQSSSRPRLALQAVKLERPLVTAITANLGATYDAEFGGFGFDPNIPDRPKFPVPTKLALLQYEAGRHGDKQAAEMLYHTLDRMAAGGIYDHLGGGFHRYSTDRFWRVPHFEKMLYDNAQLAGVYTDAFQQSNNPRYREVAEGIITFVLRDLTDAQGAFYSALDADTEGVEGKYYVWSLGEVGSVLSPAETQLCRTLFGMADTPNSDLGYVLERPRPFDDVARDMQVQPAELRRRAEEVRKKLLAQRNKRQSPLRDDKILTSWNGLMIRSLARAGVLFQKPEYVQAAEKAAHFILSSMRDDKGRLQRSYRTKQPALNGYLDDYAFLIEGLLALQQATRDEKWGNAARRLLDLQLELFWDQQQKGCFFTSHDHEAILARTKPSYDSVLPSGNSVTVRNLLRVAALSKQSTYRDRARETLELFATQFEKTPGGMTNMALALGEYLDAPDFAATGVPPNLRFQAGAVPSSRPASGVQRPRSTPITIIQVADEKEKTEKKPAKPVELVTGELYLSVDRLPPNAASKVLLQLKIAEKWHINANPAQPDFLIPTRFTLKSKLGSKLAQVRYPAGAKLDVSGSDVPYLVYSGSVNLLGVLEVPDSAAGQREELTVEVKYQACNDDQCLPPKTLTFKIPVDVAAKGQAVKAINAKLFAPPAKK